MYAAFDPLAHRYADESAPLSMAVGLATLAIETRRLYSDLVHRSEFDLLTDIHNRFSLENNLDLQIAQARQSAGVFGLIYIDLNDFKQVNDVYGHQVGDMFLQEVAIRMKRQLRAIDMLARLGGDEFAVVLPMIHSRREVEEIAQRLESSFDDPYPLDGYVLRGSASVGIALYPEDGTTRDSLLSAADAAMYVAKQTKRHVDELLSERADPPVKTEDRA
jgi:diguanylate cyclase (GGDEF)-like protein